jgi:hypothetical protein
MYHKPLASHDLVLSEPYNICRMTADTTKSTPTVNIDINAVATKTTTVDPFNSLTDGQVHFFNSSRVSTT